MRTSLLLSASAAVLLTAAGLGGCRKENGIDNNQVISRPYGVYFSDSSGALYSTTDGENISLVFPPDGALARTLVTAGKNIVWVKNNLFLSDDNGRNFNPRYFSVPPGVAWQSMALTVPSHDRVYVASTDGRGVALSNDTGRTWRADNLFDSTTVEPVGLSSFTQTADGIVYAYSSITGYFYRRTARDNPWIEVVPAGLPTATFHLSHFGNTLVVGDYGGVEGVWYSTDRGLNWSQFSGLPARRVYAILSPFEQTLLVGTDSLGVYRLQGTTFVPSNAGLETYTTVRGLSAAYNKFKNGAVRQYVYAATATGLYRSDDGGVNWDLAQAGNFVTAY